MKRISWKVTAPIGITFIAVAAWLGQAGDLNPPAGPIAPTHKTLTEVETRIAINATNTSGDADSLFKITQSAAHRAWQGHVSPEVGKGTVGPSVAGGSWYFEGPEDYASRQGITVCEG